jgi:hypothetical protein
MEIEMKNANNMKLRFGWLVAVVLSCICSMNAFAATTEDSKKQEPVHRVQFETAENPGGRPKAERSSDEHLNEDVSRIQKDRNLEALRERIVAKEQQAEVLQSRLIEISSRETSLGTRMAVIEHQLKDNNIEKLLAGVGSTKPEELRDAVRKGLIAEREGVNEQLRLLNLERARVLSSLATTDAAIESLRMELATATLAEMR